MTTGIVSNVASRQVNTKLGTKTAYDIYIDGTKYSAGFKKPFVGVGDAVEFEFKTNQWGGEIVSIVKTGASPTPSPTTASARPFATGAPSYGGKGVFPIPPLDGQRAIVRQNALTNARELVNNFITEAIPKNDKAAVDAVVDEVIRIARKFEAYACGDIDREEAIKDMTKDG